MSPLVIAIGKDRPFNYALCALLKTREIHCVPYQTGSITHDELVQMNPNLVLLDVHHRKDPCLEILAAIRRDQHLKRTKVIILTTQGCSELPALRLADDIVIKPCQIDELETKVHQALADPGYQSD